jgi:predicted  nucleic acid-binding Zn-ribbon protein
MGNVTDGWNVYAVLQKTKARFPSRDVFEALPYESSKKGEFNTSPLDMVESVDRFPTDDEQPTESLAELREQIVAVNKEYMACTDEAMRSQLKDKVKEVTDKLRKMESEIGSTFSGKSAYENLKKVEQPSKPKGKRGRPSKK